MDGIGSFALLSGAVFLGAFVSRLEGFAFSAVAGAILLHARLPLEAVPLMMACSVSLQSTDLWSLGKEVRWKQGLVLVLGGLLGVPMAVCLLQTTDARTFRELFGVATALYAGYMLFRPSLAGLRLINDGGDALVGFGAGPVGGLAAAPGPLPTMWYDVHGVPKTRQKNPQRGLVQPFIAAMQISTLALLLVHHDLSSKVFFDLLLSVPALVTGSVLGIVAFRTLSEEIFRRVILSILMVAGLLLVV